MKKTKTQKGITLIALIITIVVLLILAVVAIGAAQDSNIVGYAQNAASKYEEGKGIENNTISDMESLLNHYSTGGNSAGNNNGGINENPEGEIDEPEEQNISVYTIEFGTLMTMHLIEISDNEAVVVKVQNTNQQCYKSTITDCTDINQENITGYDGIPVTSNIGYSKVAYTGMGSLDFVYSDDLDTWVYITPTSGRF